MLAGWGLFNLVEGIVDHHLLGIHHVKPGDYQLLFDSRRPPQMDGESGVERMPRHPP